MNLKYYLRGLGLGIVVTALMMGIGAGGRKESLTDAQIRARARELGMTESTVLADYADDKQKDAEDAKEDGRNIKNSQELGTDGRTAADESPENAAPEDTASPAPEASAETPQPAEPTGPETLEESAKASAGSEEPVSTAEPAVFIINRGDGSYTVSEGLERAGLITSAVSFDHFLVENGFDKKIVAGEHMIPTDAGQEMIARIITGQE